jgi:DNA-directed RNA polymerase specialized sigma24 family protein
VIIRPPPSRRAATWRRASCWTRRGPRSPEERLLLERREQGQEWAEIAAELGGRPDALRVRLARGAARVTRELGMEDDSNG